MQQMTKEQADEIKRNLEARATARKAGETKIADQNLQWQKEIDALESRVTKKVAEIDLGGGATIAIRLCLLGSEVERLDQLERAQKTEPDAEKRAEMASEMIEIITANPLITKEWLMANRDKYSPSDILDILLGYMEVRLQERKAKIRRLQAAAIFRPESSGT